MLSIIHKEFKIKNGIKKPFKLCIMLLLAYTYKNLYLHFLKLKQAAKIKEQLAENLCKECLKLRKPLWKPKCRSCRTDILFKDIKFVSTLDTYNEILTHNRSISRFGDGEFYLSMGYNNIFQRYNRLLAKRLREVLYNNVNNLLVGVYLPYKKEQLNLYHIGEARFWNAWLYRFKFNVIKLLNKNKYIILQILQDFFINIEINQKFLYLYLK